MSERKVLRGYEIIDEIGRGGAGVIYRAYQPSVDREVAIKTLHPPTADDTKFLTRFEYEARAVARLEHPNIIPLYDFWVADDIGYLVMRYLRGGSLDDRIRQSAVLTTDEVLQVAVQIGSALDYAHRSSIIHRDIKPSNILLDEDGNAYLSDLGTATIRDVRSGEDITITGVLVGTPAYMSPEQVYDVPVDARSDIYSFAVTIYHLLTGEVPFTGETPISLLMQHVNAPFPDVTKKRSDLPAAINDVLQKATAKNPDDRYDTVRDFVTAVQNALGGMARTPTSSLPAVKPAPKPQDREHATLVERSQVLAPAVINGIPKRSSRLPLYLGAAVMVLLIAGGLWYLFGRGFILDSTEGEVTINSSATLLLGVGVTTALGLLGIIYFFNEVRPGAAYTSPEPIRRREIQTQIMPSPMVSKSADASGAGAPVSSLPTAQQPLMTYEGISVGDRIGHYELRERLDRGSRSRVYHAYDHHMKRDVAMKVINAFASGENRAARFEREAQLLGQLHHAHIVPFFDYGTEDEINYIAMPLLSGGSLRHRLEVMDTPADPQAVIAWAQNIADALDYIHSKNIIHRDLKATNIVFGEQDKAYLVDFGLAKILESGANQLTMQGEIMGTPDTISPEMVSGEDPVPGSDQYSFAVLLYEVLTGEKLFKGSTAFEVLSQHMQAEPPLASTKRADLPPAVDAVFRQALAKVPADRYPNVRTFVSELGQALTVSPVPRGKHVFISYSRVDTDYAFRLADAMRAKGLEVWIDDRINPSDSWWHTIVEAIEGCSAFVVLMTPASADSRWVYRETLLADQRSKPAFPILLDGEIFPLYVGTQAVRVTPQSLPPDAFFTGLKTVLGGEEG